MLVDDDEDDDDDDDALVIVVKCFLLSSGFWCAIRLVPILQLSAWTRRACCLCRRWKVDTVGRNTDGVVGLHAPAVVVFQLEALVDDACTATAATEERPLA